MVLAGVGAIVLDMRRHEQRVTVTNEREIVLRLPSDFPVGEADTVIRSNVREPASARSGTDLVAWLDNWIASLPRVPHIDLDSIDRDDIYPSRR